MLDRKFHKQSGDTIVEVLLAMVVIGLTLAIGFNITNVALQTGRNAQERTEALKLAETQLEFLKNDLGDTSLNAANYRITNYCITAPGTIVGSASNPASACTSYNGSFYDVRIDFDAAASFRSYKASVSWIIPNSSERGVVELLYRPYEAP